MIEDKGGLTFSPALIKQRINVIKSDPKKLANFSWSVVRFVIWSIAIIIGFQFLKVIIGFNTGSSSMTMLGRLFIFLALMYIFYTIYEKAYKPMKARVLHYNNMDTQIAKIQVLNADDSVNEIDKTLDKFKKEKGGNQ